MAHVALVAERNRDSQAEAMSQVPLLAPVTASEVKHATVVGFLLSHVANADNSKSYASWASRYLCP